MGRFGPLLDHRDDMISVCLASVTYQREGWAIKLKFLKEYGKTSWIKGGLEGHNNRSCILSVIRTHAYVLDFRRPLLLRPQFSECHTAYNSLFLRWTEVTCSRHRSSFNSLAYCPLTLTGGFCCLCHEKCHLRKEPLFIRSDPGPFRTYAADTSLSSSLSSIQSMLSPPSSSP